MLSEFRMCVNVVLAMQNAVSLQSTGMCSGSKTASDGAVLSSGSTAKHPASTQAKRLWCRHEACYANYVQSRHLR
jgi:hypothetical protein